MANTVDAKLLRQTKFPPEFNRKVDMNKVNIEVMKKWIAGKISEILGNEDDVVTELCFNLLEGARFPDIKSLQIQLTGFLDKDTPKFCKQLWSLCLSAQDSPQGVPKELLEAKKLELMQEKMDAERASEGARHRAEQEKQRDRDIDRLRKRERAERDQQAAGGRRRPRERYAGDEFNSSRSSRQHRDRDRSGSPPVRESISHYSGDRVWGDRTENGRRNQSRSPYRRSRNDHHRSTHPRRHSYSSDSEAHSPGNRRAGRHRSPSRSDTPPQDRSSYKRRRSPSTSQSPKRRKDE